MPARSAPITEPVPKALMTATDPVTGQPSAQVPFDKYKSYFEGSWYPLR